MPQDVYTGMTSGYGSMNAMRQARKSVRDVEHLMHTAQTSQAFAKKNQSQHRSRLPVIDPRSSQLYHVWEWITGLVLIFVAIATPVEVGIMVMTPCVRYSLIWNINRVVDVLFLIDMVLQFFVMVKIKQRDGTRWTVSHRLIASKYLRGWFLLDVLSVGSGMFDILPVFCPSYAGDEAAGAVSSGAFKPTSMRLLRLARLIKLARLVRGSQVLRHVESTFPIQSGSKAIFEIICFLSIITHWLACFLTLQVCMPAPCATDRSSFENPMVLPLCHTGHRPEPAASRLVDGALRLLLGLT